MGAQTAQTQAGTTYEPVPGLVYLRRPQRCGGDGPVDTPEAAQKQVQVQAGDAVADRTAPPQQEARRTGRSVSGRVGMLIAVWLEVLDGRRPVSVLRKGPFNPLVVEELRGRLRRADAASSPDSPDPRPAPSRVLSVHLPPTHRERLAFTASVTHGGRVRAVAGHLGRYDGRWRIESVTLI